MQRIALLLSVAAVSVAVGCKSNNPAQLDPVPPPVESDGAGYAGSAGTYDQGASQPQVVTIQPQPVDSGPVVVSPAGGQTYTVQKGDTLYRIAKMHYGNGNRWQEIADANGISDPKKLYVGKVLTLP